VLLNHQFDYCIVWNSIFWLDSNSYLIAWGPADWNISANSAESSAKTRTDSNAMSTQPVIRWESASMPAILWSISKGLPNSSRGDSSKWSKISTQVSPSTSNNSSTSWSNRRSFWNSTTPSGKIWPTSAPTCRRSRTFRSLERRLTAKLCIWCTRPKTSSRLPKRRNLRRTKSARRSSSRNQ